MLSFMLSVRNLKKGMKIAQAREIRVHTENQGSTSPAKYTPIKLNEKAHKRVVNNK